MATQMRMSKATVESAYPSPADEIKDTIGPASPAQYYQSPDHSQRRPSHPGAGNSLPSLREILQQPISPSTSPYVSPEAYGASPGSLPMPQSMTDHTSGNGYADNLYRPADPQLFPERAVLGSASGYAQQPLFPTPQGLTNRGRPSAPQLNSRRRKRTPHRAPSPSPLEPRKGNVAGAWARAAVDPVQWFQERREEDQVYWADTQIAQYSNGADMARGSSSQGSGGALSSSAKRPRHDSATQVVESKRRRRGEGQSGTRSSPRDAPSSSFFNTVLSGYTHTEKASKPAAKSAVTSAQSAKKIKQHPEEPDRAYEYYKDTTPDVSTLDKGVKFTASWSGKPLNLDNDPDRGLLHEEEIRLASKLALSCARYLYLKRRFYAGRLDFARKTQLYNINAAQQQCKGQDMYGIVGADVNKTSSMWKAFNSVGWLNATHMDRYV